MDSTVAHDAIHELQLAWQFRTNSLAAYIVAADPYVDASSTGVFEAVQEVASIDQQLATELAAAIESSGTVPIPRPFDPTVGELNYLDIRYLAELLRSSLERELRRVEELQERFRAKASTWSLVIEQTRKQLQKLGDAGVAGR